jgi:alpha-L-rhamnosidase
MAPTPSDLLATAYYARCAGIMAEVARALGKKADERRFAALRRKVAAAYRREFVTDGGRVAGDTQTGYLVTLGFGLVDDPGTVARMMDRLAFLIESRGYSLTTGFLGTPLLCPVLTRFGRADLAYRLLQRREYPSWYFPIIDGDATTMWERWNGYSSKHGFGDVSMNSFNHYAYGAVGEWVYETVGGIAPAEPGFRKIRFMPVPGGDITWARTSLTTRHGTASIEWRLAGGKKVGIEVTLVVPPNTTAVLELPGHAPRDLSSGRHRLCFKM